MLTVPLGDAEFTLGDYRDNRGVIVFNHPCCWYAIDGRDHTETALYNKRLKDTATQCSSSSELDTSLSSQIGWIILVEYFQRKHLFENI